MNKFILFLVLFNSSVFGHTSSEGNFNCTPSEVFQRDCNTCTCNEDGKNATCTFNACNSSPIVQTTENNLITTTEDIFEHNSNSAAVNTNGNQVCTPNEIKMHVEINDICNRCKCAANGIGWFCTKIPCPSREIQKRTIKRSLSRRGCKSGDILSDGCNRCVCDAFGVPSCTNFPCLQQRRKRSIISEKCTPGDRWKHDCNDCFCTETGVGACTLRGCISSDYTSHRISIVPSSSIRTVTMEEFNHEDFQCELREYFWLECNSCKCSIDGKSARCTKISCSNVTRK